ncbi:MAG TPA: hypothetical protein PLI27_01830 [Ignavibacteriales bacterium]|nr:hypothetical protein [Ignavibacteriales bacterium]HOL80928.1 hypothetical protein [Ignavibacteriales bacterium]HOM64663.1 hypothetical protein [Ignavibacteriales bacterium]HPD66806.1 hypothetical protein [Ignavibacteriales bacterium]HPP32708.1 hypothetical protein [Ignavibacteriales bacterium]
MRNIILLVCLVNFVFSQSTEIFNYSLNYTGDVNNNLSGGIKKGSVYIGKVLASLNVNTGFLGVEKGNFSASVLNSHGSKFSEKFVGDLQTLSNIENDNATYIYELWYSYNFDDLTFKIGYIDLNSDFIIMKSAETFLNSSLQVFPNLSLNYPLSIFPRPNFGVHLDYKFNDNNILRLAYFDVEEVSNTKLMLNTKLFNDNYYNIIAEYDYQSELVNAKLGTFYQNKVADINDFLAFYSGIEYKLQDDINIFAQIGLNSKNNVDCKNYVAGGYYLVNHLVLIMIKSV